MCLWVTTGPGPTTGCDPSRLDANRTTVGVRSQLFGISFDTYESAFKLVPIVGRLMNARTADGRGGSGRPAGDQQAAALRP